MMWLGRAVHSFCYKTNILTIAVVAFCIVELVRPVTGRGNVSRDSLAVKPVTIATIFAHTGIAADSSDALVKMVDLAVERVNREGGVIGRPLEVISIDNKSTPIGSRDAAIQAIDAGVTAVIGAHWSSHSLIIAPLMQDASIPMITPTSTNPQVTKGRNYIFRICFLDSAQGLAVGRFAAVDLGAGSAAIIRNIDEKYSIALADFFKRSYERFGGRVVFEGEYRGDAMDFSDLISRLVQHQPEIIYLPGYTRDAGLFVKQARAMGIEAIFLGGDGWDDPYPIAGDALIGSYKTVHFHKDCACGHVKELEQLHKMKSSGMDLSSGSLAYDAVMVLRDAIERAGTSDPAAVREALAETKGFQGLTGRLTFDENGDPVNKKIIIVSFNKGWSVVKSIPCN